MRGGGKRLKMRENYYAHPFNPSKEKDYASNIKGGQFSQLLFFLYIFIGITFKKHNAN